ncbi:MAG TPA: hypothetical protein VFG51_02955 [Candidatus Saccharimonadia bacterium]|nr:hypothetical protein [Candidatus Saccharimonadia bacterium]
MAFGMDQQQEMQTWVVAPEPATEPANQKMMGTERTMADLAHVAEYPYEGNRESLAALGIELKSSMAFFLAYSRPNLVLTDTKEHFVLVKDKVNRFVRFTNGYLYDKEV